MSFLSFSKYLKRLTRKTMSFHTGDCECVAHIKESVCFITAFNRLFQAIYLNLPFILELLMSENFCKFKFVYKVNLNINNVHLTENHLSFFKLVQSGVFCLMKSWTLCV